MMNRVLKRFGWIPDSKDERDYKFQAVPTILEKLPEEASVEDLCPVVYNQGDSSSCVANASASAIISVHLKQGLPQPDPSRMFIYYGAREIEGTTHEDAGCMNRNAIKTLAKFGVCSETDWPFIPRNYSIRPSIECYSNAKKDIIISYHRIDSIPEPNFILQNLKACIAEGYPFIFGIPIYENFPIQTSSGIIPMPKGREIGGHALFGIAYNDYTNSVRFLNSWDGWGDGGYGELPYDYISKYARDIWTIRSMEITPTVKELSGTTFLDWITILFNLIFKSK